MAKDLFHYHFVDALKADGWLITHDPYDISIDGIDYAIDVGAEKLIAAEKDNRKIAVEIKNFVGPSDVNEFHKAVGQFNDYFVALEEVDEERILYLAVPENTYNSFFQKRIIQKALKRADVKIVVFKPRTRTIVTWIN